MEKIMNIVFNRKVSFVILLALSILWMSVIFGFSSRSADESTVQSNSVTEFLINLLEDDFETLTEFQKQILVEKYDGIVRKVAHFGIFGILGFLTYFTTGSLKWIPKRVVKPLVISVPFCVLFAIADEYHQSFVPGRSCQIKDMIIDSWGVICGTLAGIILILISRMIFKQKN